MSDTSADLSFEAIVKRLEHIASELENGEPSLEDALNLFEEGVRLQKMGSERLDAAERRLEILQSDGSTTPHTLDTDF